jgi:CRISPR-associated protein Cmx8
MAKGKEPQTALEPIRYDPLNPELTTLHRAGIAGLLLQIKAMEVLREEASESEKWKHIIPEYEPIHGGRGITITFDKASFYSLMRERYRGIRVESGVEYKERDKPKKEETDLLDQRSEKGKTKKLPPPKRYVCKWPHEEGKFVYLDPKPRLQHFEVFKANEDWQKHTREAAWRSYFCVPRTRLIFKLPSDEQKSNTIDELWQALLYGESIALKKQFYPSAGGNLKGVRVEEQSKTMLLMHFWPLVASHFTPVSLKAEKDKATKETVLRYQFHWPIVVVPDVIDGGAFVDDFMDFLGTMEATPKGRLFDDGRYIATPLEATLAFYIAPRLARGVRDKIGTRGAEAYVFNEQGKQRIVSEIVSESLTSQMKSEYNRLLARRVASMPFRALLVENSLAEPRKQLYEGFEQLVASYPLELFVATKSLTKKGRYFNPHGYAMAQSLYAEFKSIEEKERRKPMNGESTIPYLFWRISRNYIHWRACNKAEPHIDPKKINALFAKRRKDEPLTPGENKLMTGYNEAVGEVVEKLFIDFRGMREDRRFANAFTETFFRAPQMINSEDAMRLQPFYEGRNWESGRRLTLMAISAVGSQASSRAIEDVPEDIPEKDQTEES